MSDTYDPRHPHERDGRTEPAVLDAEGRCLVCARDLLDEAELAIQRLRERLVVAERERDRLAEALLRLRKMTENNRGGILTAGYVISIVDRALAECAGTPTAAQPGDSGGER
jgi:hypothetical protein